jgi:2'-5' RNA ligase
VTELVVMFGFDDTTDAALRDVWQRLADAGLHHAIEPRHRPHLSVAIVDVESHHRLVEVLDAHCESAACCDIGWSGLGVFPPTDATGTVYAAPVVTDDLLRLHDGVHRVLDEAGIERAADHPFLESGRWTPHSTLHTDLDHDGVLTAVRAAMPAFPLRDGRIDRVVVAPKAREVELWCGSLALA